MLRPPILHYQPHQADVTFERKKKINLILCNLIGQQIV